MSTTAGPGSLPETDALIHRVAGMIGSARALPLSSSVKLDNKEEILELLREAMERLPEELRQARWMLKEREEFLASTQRKAEELVEAARSEAQRMVQRTEIVKEAQTQARRTVETAREEARRMRLEAEDYADQRLAQFEIILERTLKTVAAGRQKLSGLPDKDDDPAIHGPGTFDGNAAVTSGGRVTPVSPVSGDKRRLGGLGARRPANPGPGTARTASAPSAASASAGSSGRTRSPQASNGSAHGASDGPEAGGDEQFFDQDLMG
ncbi:MAG TPA: ATP synthase F0 subunit B [Acidimicrobiales bacterium]|nr:ATP synthase F0 subunit B [Acidimicrobiales bacterium]